MLGQPVLVPEADRTGDVAAFGRDVEILAEDSPVAVLHLGEPLLLPVALVPLLLVLLLLLLLQTIPRE